MKWLLFSISCYIYNIMINRIIHFRICVCDLVSVMCLEYCMVQTNPHPSILKCEVLWVLVRSIILCMHFTGFHLVRSKNCHVFGMWPFSCDYGELSLVRNVASAQRKKKTLNLVKEVNLTFKRGVCLNLFSRKLCVYQDRN